MPKSVSPIVLNETDAITLNSIVSGDLIAGVAVQKRARAILLLSEGKQIKDTAKEIGMRENSVTEIRRRFLTNGISSLSDQNRSGRPVTKMAANDVESKVNDIISTAFSTGTSIPSVKDIAGTLNARQEIVRDILKKKGLIQQRKSNWEFPVLDTPGAKTVDLCGLFLSHSWQFILIRAIDPDSTVTSTESAVVTRSKTVASVLATAATENGFVNLAHALESFPFEAETRSSEKADALAFVKNLYTEFHNNENEEYHLFICGDSLAEHSRSLLSGISVHMELDSQAWTATAESIFSILCDKDPGLSRRIVEGITTFIHCSSNDNAIFRWKKNSPDQDVCCNSDESIQMQKNRSDKPAGTIEFEARIMGDDGKWITYTAEGLSSVRQEQFNMTDANAWLNSFDIIEQAIAKVSHDAARGINEAYAADLVKKTNSRKKRIPE